jgi:hypothetical protein
MRKYFPILISALLALWLIPGVRAAEGTKIYTNRYFLYSVDYPETWRAKEAGKVSAFYSGLQSKEDKFAENVQIVVEDLSQVPGDVSLVDYHRKGVASAEKFLTDFKVLEETTTQWQGRETIVMLYSATMRGEHFKFKDYKFIVNRTAYVLTYAAKSADFNTFLAPADRLIHSLRVSP